jgi:hypothetical protein
MSLVNRQVLILISGFLYIFALGCRPLRPSEVPGVYTATPDWGRSTLTLKGDHTAEQMVQTKDGKIRRLSGTWSLDGGDLILKPCFAVRHDEQGVRMDMCAHSIEGIGLTSVEISSDPDYGIAYRK